MNDLDPDEVALWLRHPVTQHVLAQIRRDDILLKYRGAGDLLTLGKAQGYDLAIQKLTRLLGNPDGIG